MNTAFLFSGQGSQYVGMGKDLVDNYPVLMDIYTAASHIMGFDIARYCFAGTEQDLSQTIVAQPAIMATSIAAYRAAEMKGIYASAVAGHSLGEYAAMVASGILSLEDGFKVIKARAHAMQEAAETNPGTMCAIIGKTAEEVEEICLSIEEYAVPVNYNSPSQTVIAGTYEGIEQASEAFKKSGAKVVPLNVNAAFHSRLMEPAAGAFLKQIKNIKFNAPTTCKFYSNVLGDELRDFGDMPNMLAQHMISPVRFTSELINMEDFGYDTFVECGPNKVLTGLVKKTLPNAVAVHIEDMSTLEKASETYEKKLSEEG